MKDLNNVVIRGRATKDPEFRETEKVKVASFSIASNDGHITNFFDVVCFGAIAEIASNHIKKGKALIIEGKLRQETYEGKNGKRTKVKIIAESIHFL